MKTTDYKWVVRCVWLVLLGILGAVGVAHASKSTPETSTMVECKGCPRLVIEYQTNNAVAVRASLIMADTLVTHGHPPYNEDCLLISTNYDGDGSEWATGIAPYFDAQCVPEDVNKSSFHLWINDFMSAASGQTVTNYYWTERDEWYNAFLTWEEDADMEYEENGTSFTFSYYNDYSVGDVAIHQDLTVSCALDKGKTTFHLTSHRTDVSTLDGTSSSSHTSEEGYSFSVINGNTKYLDSYNLTVAQPNFNGTYSKAKELDVTVFHPTRYRLHYRSEPGQIYTFDWDELDSAAAQNPPTGPSQVGLSAGFCAPNPNFPPGYNPILNRIYSFGAISYANPNNGTLTPSTIANGGVIFSGGNSPTTLPVIYPGGVNDPTVITPHTVPPRGHPSTNGTALVEGSKRSHTSKGTGGIEHTEWYEMRGARGDGEIKIKNQVCKSCATGHDRASAERFDIELGPGPTGNSAGHIEIDVLKRLGAVPTAELSASGASSGIDEGCFLAGGRTGNTETMDHGVAMSRDMLIWAEGRDNGRQIRTPTAVTDVETNVANGDFTVTMWKPVSMNMAANIAANTPVWAPIPGSNYVARWTVVANTNSNPRTLTITNTGAEGTKVYLYSYDETTGSLSFTQPTAGADEARVDIERGTDNGDELETVKHKNNLGVISEVTQNRYRTVGSAGRVLVATVDDPAGAALTTTRDYFSDPGDGKKLGRLKWLIGPTGGWTRYEYDAEGRQVKEITGKDNTPFSATDEAGCIVTEYSYTPLAEDNSADTDTPRATTVSINGTAVSKSYTVLTTNYTKFIQCITPTAGVDDSANLVDTVWPCREGSVWTLGRTRKVDYADGTREVHFYDFPNENVVVESVLSGTPDPANIVNVIKGTRSVIVQRPDGKVISQSTYDLGDPADASPQETLLSRAVYSNFDGEHRPRRATYLDGSTADISYACCGVESISRSDGLVVNYEYDLRKRVKFETYTMGPKTLTLGYTYDANDRVLFVSRKWNAEATAGSSGAKFDLAGRLVKSTNALMNLVDSFNYSTVGGQPVVTTTYPNLSTKVETYNRDGSLAKVTGTAVAPVRFDSDVEALDGINHIFTKQSAVDQNGNNPTYWAKSYWDGAMRAVKATSSAGNAVHFNYNTQGRLSKVSNADGLSVLRTYNDLGLPLLSVLDMHGDGMLHLEGSNRVSKTLSKVVHSDADENGPVYQVKSYVWPTVSNPASLQVGEVKVSLDGRRVWKTVFNNGVGVTTRSVLTFDAVTKKYTQTKTAPTGTLTTSVSLHGLLLESKSMEANGTVLRYQTNGYDARNRLTRVWDSRNGMTTINYNTKDQVTSVVGPSPGPGLYGQQTAYTYNAFGQVVKTTLPDGTSRTNGYYPNGLLASEWGSSSTYGFTIPFGYGSYTPLHGYTYDDRGRMTEMKNWSSANDTQVTRWNYNATSGRLDNMRYPDKTTGAAGAQGEDYQYTAGGRLWKKTTARGVVSTYDYDGAGALTKAVFTGETSGTTPDIVRSYNRLGRIAKVEHGGQTLTRDYNDAGQLLTEAYTAGPLAGLSVGHTYNTLLQRESMTAANGATALTGMGYGFTPAGGGSPQARLQTVTGGPASIAFNYEANSSLLQAVNYGGNSSPWISRTLQHDFLNRLKQITTSPGGETHAYLYDVMNRRTRDSVVTDGTRLDYSYNWLGQLTWVGKFKADGSIHINGAFAYTDDWMGNPVSAQSQTVGNNEVLSYAANKQNQLTSVPHSAYTAFIGKVSATANISVQSSSYFEQTPVRQGEDYRVVLNTGIENTDRYLAFTNYAVLNSSANAPDVVATGVVNLFLPKGASEVPVYDLDGNLTSDGRWTYSWDALNRLKSIESKTDAPAASKHKLVFTYDAGGRRIQKEEFTWNTSTLNYQPSTTLKFLYDGWDMVAELDGSSAPLRSYGWLGKGGGLLWMKDHASGAFHVPGYDGNGNITRLINYTDRTVSAEYEYGPYGGLLRATGPMAQAMPFRFSSEYQDDVTGLVYYGYRYYSPQTRRWLSKDPIGLAGGLNLYGFVGNDPINNWDLLGLADGKDDKCEEFWKGLADKVKKVDEGLQPATDAANAGMKKFDDLNRAVNPVGAAASDGYSNFSDWLKDNLRQLGQGAYDLAMGDEQEGSFDQNTQGALRGQLGLGIDANNNALRDSLGEGAVQVGGVVQTAVELALTRKLSESGGGTGKGGKRPNKPTDPPASPPSKPTTPPSANPPVVECPDACFVAGTMVATENGQKPIEDIKEGDLVWSENVQTGEVGLRKVLRTFIHSVSNILNLVVADETIQTTDTHPFWVVEKGWKQGAELQADDVLLTMDGRMLQIQKLEHRQGDFTVYNIEVEDFHTYFVSHERVLVHNKAMARPRYERGSGHGVRDTADKSRAPLDGQGALNGSIQVKPTSPRRVGIDNDGNFVVLDRDTIGQGSNPDIFHGHVRTWDDLTTDMQNALIEAGQTTRKGKVLE